MVWNHVKLTSPGVSRNISMLIETGRHFHRETESFIFKGFLKGIWTLFVHGSRDDYGFHTPTKMRKSFQLSISFTNSRDHWLFLWGKEGESMRYTCIFKFFWGLCVVWRSIEKPGTRQCVWHGNKNPIGSQRWQLAVGGNSLLISSSAIFSRVAMMMNLALCGKLDAGHTGSANSNWWEVKSAEAHAWIHMSPCISICHLVLPQVITCWSPLGEDCRGIASLNDS